MSRFHRSKDSPKHVVSILSLTFAVLSFIGMFLCMHGLLLPLRYQEGGVSGFIMAFIFFIVFAPVAYAMENDNW